MDVIFRVRLCHIDHSTRCRSKENRKRNDFLFGLAEGEGGEKTQFVIYKSLQAEIFV